MASIICSISAQCTQNVFLRLDTHQRGYLDEFTLEQALVEVSQSEVRQLLLALDQDGDRRISPYELNLAMIDWLSEVNAMPCSRAFASLIMGYGLEEGELNQKRVVDVRRHTTSAHRHA